MTAKTIQTTVNDALRELPEGTTVAALLDQLDLNIAHVAVERNRVLVPRREHATTVLVSGDRIEVVTLVGGG